MNFLTNLNLTKNQLLNAALHNAILDPVNPVIGQMYFNTASNRAFVFDGTSWIGMDSYDASMTGAEIVTAINNSTSIIDDDNLSTSVNSAITNSHSHTNKSVLDATTASFTTTDETKLDGIEAGAQVNVATNIGVTQDADSADLTSSTGTGASITAATTTTAGVMSAADKTKLNGIAAGATANTGTVTSVNAGNGMNFTSITSSGSVTLGTPSTLTASTTNSVTATSHTHAITGFSLDSHTHSQLHDQNTDTGTTNSYFQIDSDASGPRLVNNAGVLYVMDATGAVTSDLRVDNLTVDGTLTTVSSEDVNIGDSMITLNADITAYTQNSDGGFEVKRLATDNTTRKDAKIIFNNSLGVWQVIDGAISGDLVTSQIARKATATIGDGVATSFVITHNLNTRDVNVNIRETASPYAMVITDIEMTTVNTITVKFAEAPTTNQYAVTITG